jgi:hypothetical protein
LDGATYLAAIMTASQYDQGLPGVFEHQCTPASPLGTGVTAVDDCGPDCNPALLDPVNGLLLTP